MQIVAYALTWLLTHVRSERGQDLIEYAMLGGLIAIGLIAAGVAFQGPLESMATGIGTCIDFTPGGCDPF